jgi:hypothetical protein
MLGAVIRSHADLALGFTFWPDDFVAAPDRAQMYEPVPLPCESRGFAQRAPPPGSFVSSGQADSERRPSRAGLQAELEHALLLRARLVTGASSRPTTRPAECLQVGDGGRVTGWRLLPAQSAVRSIQGD